MQLSILTAFNTTELGVGFPPGQSVIDFKEILIFINWFNIVGYFDRNSDVNNKIIN